MKENNNHTGVSVIIDGNSVAYRAFFKAPPLTAGDIPTGVVHVFLTVLEKLEKTAAVDNIIAVFDAKGRNKRHELSESYKATREAMPEDLAVQLDILKDIIPAAGIPLYCVSGYEADDVINTLVKRSEGGVWIVSKDKDLHQLVDGRVKIYDYNTGEIIGPEEVFEKFGLYPGKIADMLSLSGDTSDNVPGVPGIGPKTARELLFSYGSLDGVYANIKDIKGKLKEKLEAGKESAYLSRKLVELMDVPDLPVFEARRDEEELRRQYGKYRLKYHLSRLELPKIKKEPEAPEEISPAPFLTEEDITPWEPGHVTDTVIIIACGEAVYKAGGGFYQSYEPGDKAHMCYDVKALIKKGVYSEGERPLDIMLACWLADPDSGGVKRFKGETEGSFIARLAACGKDVEKKLASLCLEKLYYDMELPVAGVLARAEVKGIGIDGGAVKKVASDLKNEVVTVLSKISNRAMDSINPNSPRQLGAYLYDTLGLKPGKKNKRGYSTDEESLVDLKNAYPDKGEIIDDILKYRELNKLLSTYTASLLEFRGKDGRIRTDFRQTGTATGRLSSVNPNLQNIPQGSGWAKALREAFIPAEGYSFVSLDYSQIELRILAHLSGDENLIKSFMDDVDIHSTTARSIFHLPEEEDVPPELRRIAKAVNFGILYGLSSFGLARDARVPASEAKVFIERYFALYPKVRSFIEETVETARENGCCETIFGRKRFIKDIKSRNANIRQRAERMAINAPIQGSAADIIKLAMIACDRYIRENNLDGALVLQLHDELVFEVKDGEAAQFMEKMKDIMESAVKMKVPLTVHGCVGKNWGEL